MLIKQKPAFKTISYIKAKRELEMIFYEADSLIREIDRDEALVRSKYLENKYLF